MSTDPKKKSAVDMYAGGPKQLATEDSEHDEHAPFFKREKEARGPALALTLLLRNGNRKTVPYHLLIEMDFDPEIGIVMYYSSGVKITIVGLHLGRLYSDLAEHRILEVRSMDNLVALNEHRKIDDVTGKDAPLVQEVIIERGMIDADTGVWKAASGVWNVRNQQWQPKVLN